VTGYVATMDSEKFSWLAFGETEAEALAALDRGFKKHLEQVNRAWTEDDPPRVYYGANVHSVKYGWCYRDDYRIVTDRTTRPLPSVDALARHIVALLEQDFGAVGITLFRSFSELQDVVDANEYMITALNELGIDFPDFGSQAETDLVNAATDKVSAWLAEHAHPRTTITRKDA